MDAEVKALNERIERLEKIIVFLICSTDYDGGDNPHEILQKSPQYGRMNNQAVRVKNVLEEFGSAEQVIKEAFSIYKKRLSS